MKQKEMTPEQLREYHRQWRHNNRDKYNKIQRQWYHRNKEFLKEQKRIRKDDTSKSN